MLHSRFLLLQHGRLAKPPAEVTSGSPPAYGLALSQAVVQKLPGGPSLWLVPGTRETCLAFVDPAASYARTSFDELCQKDSFVLKYGALVEFSGATHQYIFGVQPGSAHSVTATTNEGRKKRTDSSDGVYKFETSRPKFIRTVSTPGGPIHPTTPDWL